MFSGGSLLGISVSDGAACWSHAASHVVLKHAQATLNPPGDSLAAEGSLSMACGLRAEDPFHGHLQYPGRDGEHGVRHGEGYACFSTAVLLTTTCGLQAEFMATFSTQIGTVGTGSDMGEDVARFAKQGYKKIVVTRHQVGDNPKHVHVRFHVRDEFSPPSTSIKVSFRLWIPVAACAVSCLSYQISDDTPHWGQPQARAGQVLTPFHLYQGEPEARAASCSLFGGSSSKSQYPAWVHCGCPLHGKGTTCDTILLTELSKDNPPSMCTCASTCGTSSHPPPPPSR